MPLETPLEQSASLDEVGADEPFVGRRLEMEAIAASLAAVVSGTGRVDIVRGAAGIGKTRLAHEIAAVARADGFCVLRGACWEGDGAPSYWPLVEILRTVVGARGDGGHVDFGQLLSAASARMSVASRTGGEALHDAQQARFVLFDWVCEIFAGLAARQPTLVIVDDLHWADTSTLLLLKFLAGRLANMRVALLLTSREPLSELGSPIGRHPWARDIVLTGLNRTEASALLAAPSTRTLPSDVLDQLMTLTEGNPYFLKELGHHLGDRTQAAGHTGALALPASLRVFTLQQFERLSLGSRTLLQAASVIGREFDAELATQAASMAIRDALPLLDEAVEHRVIVLLGTTRYRFRHALVREAVLDQLHVSERTRLHESIALGLERSLTAGERVSPATLAHHFCLGLPFTPRRRAAAYGIAAGEEAHRAFAYEEAVFQFRRAQEISGASRPDVESCDLLLLLGAAEAGAGEWSRSRRTFEDAAALARRIDSPERLARAALGFKGMMWATMPPDLEAICLLEEARDRLNLRSTPLEIELLSAISRCLYFSDDTARASRYSDQAVRLARESQDPRLEAIALESHTVCLLQPATIDRVLASAEKLVALGDQLRDPHLRFNARIFRQFALLTFGRIHQADRELEQASTICAATPNPRFQWQVSLLRGARATLRGNLPLAVELSTVAQELGRRVHDSSPAQYDLLQAFQRALLRNELENWSAAAATAVARSPTIPAFKVAYALILARLSDLDLARELLHELAPRNFAAIAPNNLSIWLLTTLADVAALTGQHSYAATLYDLLLPHAGQYVVAAWGTLLDGSVSHYLGLLAASLGLNSAGSHYRAAIQANRTIGAPALTARTKLAWARHLLAHADKSRCHHVSRLARDAEGTFTSLGMTAYAKQAKALQESAGPPKPMCAVMLAPSDAHTLPSPKQSFRRHGDHWSITFAGTVALLRHSTGLHYLAVLLQHQGRSIHVLDLVAPFRPPDARRASRTSDQDGQSDLKARQQYRDRLRELSHQIDEADSNHDIGTLGRLVRERDLIVEELSRAFDIRGKPRPIRSDTERARVSVRNRLTSALRMIARHHQPLARHLERSLKTGAFCIYDPLSPVDWHF